MAWYVTDGGNGDVVVFEDDDPNTPAQFATEDDALEYAMTTILYRANSLMKRYNELSARYVSKAPS